MNTSWKPKRKKRNKLRDEIRGVGLANDRLYRVNGPNLAGAFTEYNGEITGATATLRGWCRYGWNARYAIGQLVKNGCTITEIEDRQ